MGAADGSAQASIVQGNKDAVATSAGFARYDGSNALNLRTDDDSAVTVASVKSLDAGGYTLTYSTADATARKVLVWGIGAGTLLDPQIVDIDTDNIIDAAQTGVEIHGQDLQQGVTARIVSGNRAVYVENYRAPGTEIGSVTFTPADTSPWIVPDGVRKIVIGATGAGGKGADVTSAPNSGGGGGGGAWSGSELTVTPGQPVYFNVPADNSSDAWLNIDADEEPADASDGVLAESGKTGTMAAGGAGGAAANGVGQTRYSGGTGYFQSPNPNALNGFGAMPASITGPGADGSGFFSRATGGYDGSPASSFGMGGVGAAWKDGTGGPYTGGAGGPGQIDITMKTVDEITFDVPPLQDLLDAGIKFGTVKVEVVK